MPRVLIIAEHDHRCLHVNTAKCVTGALGIGAPVDIAVFSNDGRTVAEQAAMLDGVSAVRLVERPENLAPTAAGLAPQIAALAARYSHVLGPSSTFGKDLMPRVAAVLGVGQLSDVMAVEGPHRFRRPIYAGNAIVTVEASPDRVLVATVRTASFAAAASSATEAAIEAVELDVELPRHTRFVKLESGAAAGPDLQTAARVVAGGRGVGSKERFALIEQLAGALGAAIGASRAAVDAGYVSNDLQVGQTGKIIAPELYFAIGISGAIQHLTGIKDAGTVVAINRDSEAPIFDAADFGLVGDLFEVVPALVEALQASERSA